MTAVANFCATFPHGVSYEWILTGVGATIWANFSQTFDKSKGYDE
jgi:hypothetical protein